jgi:two-component system LytT family response regulator
MEMIEPLNVIVIDDEMKSRETLKYLIEDFTENVKVVATAEDVLSGVKEIQKHEPDVIFVDIEMPNYSGFNLVEYFDEVHFDIVFVTAYEKYALKAHKVDAIGYLLKPVSIEDLEEVIQMIRRKRQEDFGQFQSRYTSEKNNHSRIILPAIKGLLYLNLDEICYLESTQGRYTEICLVNGEKMICTMSLKNCMEKLNHSTFIRVHRSYIINLLHINSYARGRDSHIILDDGFRVEVGMQYKDELNKVIAIFPI